MEYITVNTITYGNKRVTFTIESEALFKLHCMSGITIEVLDKIHQICIVEDVFVLKTEVQDLRNGFYPVPFYKEDRSENNILAFDSEGIFLWNIGSIVGNIKIPFDNIFCVFKSEVEAEFGTIQTDASEVLLRCIAGGWTFIIDVKKRMLLYKVAGRVK